MTAAIQSINSQGGALDSSTQSENEKKRARLDRRVTEAGVDVLSPANQCPAQEYNIEEYPSSRVWFYTKKEKNF